MTENTFLPHRLQESARLVRAREPRMKYHLPTDGGSRPLPRGIKGSVLISERKPYYEVGISRTDAGTGNKGGTAGE